MSKEDREHRQRLEAMIAEDQQTWDLSDADVAAIEWALDEIDSLELWRSATPVPPEGW